MTSQLNNIPKKKENEELKQLFLAIYFNDIDKVVEFRNNNPEIYKKKNCFLINNHTIFDLSYLTFFNQIIWNDDDWTKEIMPQIKKNRQRTEQMLDYWRAELGQDKIDWQIEYNKYSNFFYCNDLEDTETIYDEPISYFMEKGFREIDLRLYNRVTCFDFEESRKLLQQGAKSNIKIGDYDDHTTMSRILGECSFLETCQIIPEYRRFVTEGYNQNFDITLMFCDLLGLAAHDEMYHLLKEF